MYDIPNHAVAQWANNHGYVVPASIDTVCPHCRRSVTFSGMAWESNNVRGMPTMMRCPGCGDATPLIRLGRPEQSDVRLYADADRPGRSPVPGLDLVPDDVMPHRLRREYQSALNVLSLGEAPATAVTCRRVLEGVTALFLTDEAAKKRPLHQRISAMASEHARLSQPLIELSTLLRQGGNRGAHFVEDDDLEPTIEDAGLMLDLLDYLFTYLFVVPQQIHNFREQVLERTSAVEGESSDDG